MLGLAVGAGGNAVGCARLAFVGLVLAAALACFAAPLAHAQQTAEVRARKLFEEGTSLLDAGDYAAALDKYRAAYALEPRAKIALNIGVVLLVMGESVQAANQLASYLDMPDRDPAKLARVQQELAVLDASLGRVTIAVSAPGALVSIDGDEVGAAPLPRAIRVAPGVHRVRVVHTARGFDGGQTVDVAAGASSHVTVKIPDARASTPPRSGGAIQPEGGSDAVTVRRDAPPASPAHRLGAFFRTDVDLRGRGAIGVPGLLWRPSRRLHVLGAALIGRDRGGELGARFVIAGARLRTFTTVAMPVFVVDGVRAGARASLGLAWIASGRVWITAEVGAAYAPSVPDGYSHTTGIASLGLELGL